jgi:hypothetical protein
MSSLKERIDIGLRNLKRLSGTNDLAAFTMKHSILNKFLFWSLQVFLFCPSVNAQMAAKCDGINTRIADSVTYISGSSENDQILIFIERQYGLRKGNLFDFIIFTANVSIPVWEKDSLGIVKNNHSDFTIILDDQSALKIDAPSGDRVQQYLKPPGYRDMGYRSGRVDPWPETSQTTSFRILLTEDELKQLLQHKLKLFQVNDSYIPVTDKVKHLFAKQIKCIAAAKYYRPQPKGNSDSHFNEK